MKRASVEFGWDHLAAVRSAMDTPSVQLPQYSCDNTM